MNMVLTRLLTGLLVVCSALLAGCFGESRPETETTTTTTAATQPAWVSNPFHDGQLGAVGVSLPSWVPQTAITQALANGRAELANTISVRVQSGFASYMSSGSLSREASESVTRTIADEILVGSHQRAIWTAPNRDVYVWVVLDPDTTRQAVSRATDAARTVMESEGYLRAAADAREAEAEMDRLLANKDSINQAIEASLEEKIESAPAQ